MLHRDRAKGLACFCFGSHHPFRPNRPPQEADRGQGPRHRGTGGHAFHKGQEHQRDVQTFQERLRDQKDPGMWYIWDGLLGGLRAVHTRRSRPIWDCHNMPADQLTRQTPPLA